MAEERPASSDPSDTRNRLLHAAAAVFGERGYDGAGVVEIARRAGLTTGAIYSRFADKAELLLDAIDAASSEEVRALLAADRAGDATNVLATIGTHLVDSEPRPGPLLLEAFVAARRDPELSARLLRRVEDQDAWLAKLVDEAKADRSIDADLDTGAIVTLCHAIALGFVLLRSVERPLPSADAWRGVIDRLILAAAITPTKEEP